MSEQQKVSENIIVYIHQLVDNLKQMKLKKAMLEKPPEWKITRYDKFLSGESYLVLEIKKAMEEIIAVAKDQANQGHISQFKEDPNPELTIANILFAIPPLPDNKKPRLISGR